MKWHKLRFIAYDTICTISAPEDANPHIDEILEAGRDIALQIQSTLNMFDAQSELSLLWQKLTHWENVSRFPNAFRFFEMEQGILRGYRWAV